MMELRSEDPAPYIVRHPLLLESKPGRPCIEVRIVIQYGQERVQPVCAAAKHFCALVKTKALLPEDLEHIQALGFDVKVMQDVA